MVDGDRAELCKTSNKYADSSDNLKVRERLDRTLYACCPFLRAVGCPLGKQSIVTAEKFFGHKIEPVGSNGKEQSSPVTKRKREQDLSCRQYLTGATVREENVLLCQRCLDQAGDTQCSRGK